jgi:hypothetical protein
LKTTVLSKRSRTRRARIFFLIFLKINFAPARACRAPCARGPRAHFFIFYFLNLFFVTPRPG